LKDGKFVANSVDISSTVIFVYDIQVEEKRNKFSVSLLYTTFIFANKICSRIQSFISIFVSFGNCYFKTLKTLRLVCYIFRPAFKFKFNFILKAGVGTH